MTEIGITVRNCIPEKDPNLSLVCGNSDYAVVFGFDAPWDAYEVKAARFVWFDQKLQKLMYSEQLFEGNTVRIPAFYRTDLLLVGVYAGDALASAPAVFPCSGCITDDDPVHDAPPPDIYAQMLEYLKRLDPPAPNGFAVGDGVPEANGVTQAEIGYAYYIMPGNYDFWQETDDAAKVSATLTAKMRENGLLIAAVIHRDENVSISGDGWTLVKKSQPASYGGASQWVSVWTKQAAAGSYSVTVTQGSSTNMSVKLIALYGAQSLTAVDDTVLQTSTYTPPAVTGKRRLYMISAVYAKSGGDSFDVSNYGTLDIQAMTEQRFMVWYDYQPSLQVTPTFVYRAAGSFDPNEASALVFDIEEG